VSERIPSRALNLRHTSSICGEFAGDDAWRAGPWDMASVFGSRYWGARRAVASRVRFVSRLDKQIWISRVMWRQFAISVLLSRRDARARGIRSVFGARARARARASDRSIVVMGFSPRELSIRRHFVRARPRQPPYCKIHVSFSGFPGMFIGTSGTTRRYMRIFCSFFSHRFISRS